MSHLPIPLAVVYAGLGGTLLALCVATATNKWSLRVFVLLALRLAIGWHFLFEGLYKVQSHATGPTETNRPFSSEMYFKVAPGPIGAYMRNQFSDPGKEIAEKLTPLEAMSAEAFAKLQDPQQAERCPAPVAEKFDALQADAVAALKAAAEKELKDADTAEAKAIKDTDDVERRALKGEWTQDELARIQHAAKVQREKAHSVADGRRDHIRDRIAQYDRIGTELTAALKMQPDTAMAAKQLEVVLSALRAKATDELKAASATELKAIEDANAIERRAISAAWTEAEKAKIAAKAEADRKLAKELAEQKRTAARKKAETAEDDGKKLVQAAKAAFARWVYGVDKRDTKVKGITGDVPLSAPERIEFVEWLKGVAKAAQDRRGPSLGTGNGTDNKRVSEFRMDAVTAESDLARDANAFVAELQKGLNGGKDVVEEPVTSRGQTMDKVTMWFLVAVGACLMFGLFTRVACLAAAGFLVMTYLAHPAFPWYPLPPNTEGNPVFVNKNIIECIALLALALYPTGRWLGLNALVLRPFCKYKPDAGEAT